MPYSSLGAINPINRAWINKQMMRILGILCFLLAPASFIGALYSHIRTGMYPETWFSVSASFYTPAAPLMIGLLDMTGLVFNCYAGYDRVDKIVAKITGSAAFMIVLCPCYTKIAPKYVGLLLIPVEVSNIIHCSSAALLFIMFAYMIGFRFTKSRNMSIKEVWINTWADDFCGLSDRKRIRNRIYYVCALVIAAFMLIQVATSIAGIKWMTIVNEWIMLTAFSVAWLTKGGVAKWLND